MKPYPTSDGFYADLGDATQEVLLKIFDTSGRLVKSDHHHNVQNKVETRGLPSGLYLVELRANDRRMVTKLVIE